MKGSIIIVLFFVAGIVAGFTEILPRALAASEGGTYALYLLMFLIGISIGTDVKAFAIIKSMKLKIFLIPLATVAGTLAGGFFIGLFFAEPLKQTISVSAGFGYYSLSSIYISKICGESAGAMALMSNMFREIITLLAVPLMARYCGSFAPVASGGATSMDTTLPIITRTIGREYGVISVFHGTVLTVLVPVIIPLILS